MVVRQIQPLDVCILVLYQQFPAASTKYDLEGAGRGFPYRELLEKPKAEPADDMREAYNVGRGTCKTKPTHSGVDVIFFQVQHNMII